MRIQLKDGTYEWIDGQEQFIRLVEQYMGDDAKHYIENELSDLSEQADYTNRKLETDLDSYESSLEEQRSAAEDMDEGTNEAIKYIRDSKRMDKSKLIDILDRVHRIYYENF